MDRDHRLPDVGPPRGGCLRLGAGLVAVAVLALPATVIRWWRKLRRGDDVRVEWSTGRLETADGALLCRLDLDFDVPSEQEREGRRRLTGTVVRLAEQLSRGDDQYHLLYRERSVDEPVALPLGPRVQALGERFDLAMARSALAGRTVVWLALGRDRPLGRVVDPRTYDPEAEGEPEALVARARARWAVATSFARDGAAVLYRVILWAPEESRGEVEALLQRLREGAGD